MNDARVSLQILSAANFIQMPWKNGQGVTSEVDVVPQGADFSKGNFEWRVSIATVCGQNQFSRFPGYDRWLTILSGTGLQLNSHALRPGQVFQFHGEDSIECSLEKDEVKDFGVIFERSRNKCVMSIKTLAQFDMTFGVGVHYLRSSSGSWCCNDVKICENDVLKVTIELTASSLNLKADDMELRLIQISLFK